MEVHTASGTVWADVYDGWLIWRGYERQVRVVGLGETPILGLRLLSGYILNMEVWQDGKLTISEPESPS